MNGRRNALVSALSTHQPFTFLQSNKNRHLLMWSYRMRYKCVCRRWVWMCFSLCVCVRVQSERRVKLLVMLSITRWCRLNENSCIHLLHSVCHFAGNEWLEKATFAGRKSFQLDLIPNQTLIMFIFHFCYGLQENSLENTALYKSLFVVFSFLSKTVSRYVCIKYFRYKSFGILWEMIFPVCSRSFFHQPL